MKKILFILIALLMLSACAPVLIGSAIVTGVNVAHDRRSAGRLSPPVLKMNCVNHWMMTAELKLSPTMAWCC